MLGHEPLIAMRRRGGVPSLVCIETQACLDRRLAREWPVIDPSCARVLIDPSDAVTRLDLRCLVGMSVVVDGDRGERVKAVVDACIAAGAKRVVGHVCVADPTRETFDLIEVFDTEGVLTWHA
jgi:hypothetical protein